jgi:hypothetical protein
MSVNRYATAAGRRYQRDVMKYLRDVCGLDAELLHLAGAEDEGDILLRLDYGKAELGTDRFVIEAKREKGFHLAEWVGQAEVEADNYAKHRGLPYRPRFVVVHARRNHGIHKSYVTTPLEEWLRQIT